MHASFPAESLGLSLWFPGHTRRCGLRRRFSKSVSSWSPSVMLRLWLLKKKSKSECFRMLSRAHTVGFEL